MVDSVKNAEADIASEQVMQKPEYVPEKYWQNNQVAVEQLARDFESSTSEAKKFREALSKKMQEVPGSTDGYDFDGMDFSEEEAKMYSEFAHSVGLTKYQAKELFGDAGTKFSEQFEAFSDKKQDEAVKKFMQGEIEKFGGQEKVGELSIKVDKAFTALKNRGIITDKEINEFKDTLTTASSLNGINALLTYAEGSATAPTISNAVPSPAAGSLKQQLSGLSRVEMIRKVAEMQKYAKTDAERKNIFDGLAFLNE
jgi:hypothetical protein